MSALRIATVHRTNITRAKHELDATDMAAGRLASKAAQLLMGKHKVDYSTHTDCGDTVSIINASKVKFSGKKLDTEVIRWHTGYPGGLRERKLSVELAKHPDELLRRIIRAMLPKNRLQSKMMRRLVISA